MRLLLSQMCKEIAFLPSSFWQEMRSVNSYRCFKQAFWVICLLIVTSSRFYCSIRWVQNSNEHSQEGTHNRSSQSSFTGLIYIFINSATEAHQHQPNFISQWFFFLWACCQMHSRVWMRWMGFQLYPFFSTWDGLPCHGAKDHSARGRVCLCCCFKYRCLFLFSVLENLCKTAQIYWVRHI